MVQVYCNVSREDDEPSLLRNVYKIFYGLFMKIQQEWLQMTTGGLDYFAVGLGWSC
jgi:hypothetical protein